MSEITSALSAKKAGLIEMIIAMLLMGTVGYFVVESGHSPHNAVFFRCIFGVIFLALFCFYKGIFKNTGLTKKSFLLVVLSGLFLVCNWIMLFASFKSASISTSTVIYHAQPFFFVLIAAVVLKETLQMDKVAWMMPAFFGVVLVANIELGSFSLSSDYIIGILLALSAAIFWAISAVIVKLLTGLKPYLITFIQLVVGICILFPFANLENIATTTDIQWSYLIILGGVHTCLVYILMYSSYQKLSTPVIAVLTFIYPAVAILVDFIFYEVSLTNLQFLGVFLIMFSSFAVNQNIPIIPRLRRFRRV